MNIILFGPPGAGKGTQAQSIVKKHNYFQLSTGDLLRNETKKGTELGKDIDKIISKGNFVSDEVVNKLLKETIKNLKFRDRIIFDGYPRSIEQSKHLNLILNEFDQKIDLIISLSVPREIIEKRIIGRVTCNKCNICMKYVKSYFCNTFAILISYLLALFGLPKGPWRAEAGRARDQGAAFIGSQARVRVQRTLWDPKV